MITSSAQDPTQEAASAPRRRGGLTGMVLADLRTLAGELGISDTAGMRKGDLIVAIKQRQAGSGSAADKPAGDKASTVADNGSRKRGATTERGATTQAPAEPVAQDAPAEQASAGSQHAERTDAPAASAPSAEATGDAGTAEAPVENRRSRQRRGAARAAGAPEASSEQSSQAGDGAESRNAEPRNAEPRNAEPRNAEPRNAESRNAESRNAESRNAESRNAETRTEDARTEDTRGKQNGQPKQDGESGGSEANQQGERQQGERGERQQGGRGNRNNRGEGNNRGESNRGESNRGENNRGENNRGENSNRGEGNNRGENKGGNNGPQNQRNDRDGNDDDGDGRGRRGRRFRERRRGRDRGADQGGQNERDIEVRDDDVLQPVAGILDVLDNYAFVRTSGYLAGPNDVYVSMSLVRKHGLRRGDAVTGAVRIAREGEQNGGGARAKFNPLVRVDTINGADPEAARKRPEFNKLTPLYPNQRLRLETTPQAMTARIIDLVMPIGKGQRALIVSPPKAGKTSVLQAIANAISVNNPECHLMVVLVDERPEEVTDMQRSVNGEVIASTFDRPPGDHTAVAELAIERAKRLVEGGMDVVVLLDSITRLGRAYNNSSPASGRILSGGVDSTALYPPKRFLGAARNIEHGGSLTIIATAMVETGSTGDTVIFEEFKGTGNAELKLDRKIAERRVFPAVDVNPSGTRKDELLMAPDEYQVALKLRRVLSGLDSQQAIDLLIDRLRKAGSNAEFLMQVAKTAPGMVSDHVRET
ncbi:transcription termination factor Rho [Rhodococcus sp. X156]|uniref:transcription termination factor Rho n=1 Tax=Rhodococcus sp. X156 TaxID=2499145 RepID=UPI001F49F3BE|nr:transcription termination factor Rho [Rhodococcus sp. X156]